MNYFKNKLLKVALSFFLFAFEVSVSAQQKVIINETLLLGESINRVEGAQVEATIVAENRSAATIKSNKEVVFKTGTWIQRESRLDATIDNTIPNKIVNPEKNWIFARAFDESGSLVTESINYFDGLGNPTQSQWKDLTRNIVLGSETLYDAQGRGVLTTLPAPINMDGNFGYDNNFSLYDYNDFDWHISGVEGSPDNPKPMDANSSLGKYYSNSNIEEPYVPATSFPYSRVEYNPCFPEQVRRSSAEGEQMKMGMGRESETYQLSVVYGELNAYNSNIPVDFKGSKTLTIDNNGNEVVTYSDLEGKLIASCLTGSTEASDIKTISNSYLFTEAYVVIHVPEEHTSIELETAESYEEYLCYPIHDSEAPNVVSQNGGIVTLPEPGVWAIYYNHLLNGIVGMPEQDLKEYTLNYHTFTWYEYDEAGRLTKTIDPKGIETTMTYNSMGELQSSNHPDEGLSRFYYHDDGRIKASVNAQQRLDAATDEVMYSYSLYDNDYRIVEVGVCEETGAEATHHFNPVDYNTRSDVTRTGYDELDPKLLQDYPDCGLTQQNLRGKVSYTETGHYATNNENGFSADYKTWYSYDHYGRVEWTAQHHKYLGLKVTEYQYHPNGSVEKVIYQPNDANERMEHIYAYDADTRLTSVTSKKVDGTDTYEQTTRYKYYTHGPLKRVEVGDGLQGIDYVYTINGMLKSINNAGTDLVYNGEALDPGKDGYGSSSIPKDAFGMSLDYYEGDYNRDGTYINTNIVNSGSQYNGNIHAIRWKTPRLLEDISGLAPHNQLGSNSEWAYVFNYNDRNWLSGATFGTYQHGFTGNGIFTANNYYKVDDLQYDENGNITSLDRSAIHGNLDMDDMTYSYYSNSNRLQSVVDAAVHPTSLNDIPQGQIDFQYNNIGQLTQKVTTPVSGSNATQDMQYDAYGKLTRVMDALNTYADYEYNDQGYRTSKQMLNQGSMSSTNYVYDINGNVLAIYNGTELIEQPVYGSGRIGSFMNQSKKYFYEINDHLGNVRAVVSRDAQGDIEVNEYCSYYPYGMPMPDRRLTSSENYRYGFQGQFAEEDDETGYNFFELRAYDSRLGRWMCPDPKGQYFSPYLAMGNNPVNRIDPDGGFDDNPPGDYLVIGGEGHYSTIDEFGNRISYDPIGGPELSDYSQMINSGFDPQVVTAKEMWGIQFGMGIDQSAENFRWDMIRTVNGIADMDMNVVYELAKRFSFGYYLDQNGLSSDLQFGIPQTGGEWGQFSFSASFLIISRGKNAGKRVPIPKNFREVKGLYSHKQPVYKHRKKNLYISPDADGHIKGIWKMADSYKNLQRKSTRMGTYNMFLERIGD